MLSTVTKYILDRVPVWILIPAAIIYTPPVIVIVALYFYLAEPRIEASINSRAELTELRYTNAIEKQNLINKNTDETLRRIDQHQTLMFEAILKEKQGR